MSDDIADRSRLLGMKVETDRSLLPDVVEMRSDVDRARIHIDATEPDAPVQGAPVTPASLPPGSDPDREPAGYPPQSGGPADVVPVRMTTDSPITPIGDATAEVIGRYLQRMDWRAVQVLPGVRYEDTTEEVPAGWWVSGSISDPDEPAVDLFVADACGPDGEDIDQQVAEYIAGALTSSAPRPQHVTWTADEHEHVWLIHQAPDASRCPSVLICARCGAVDFDHLAVAVDDRRKTAACIAEADRDEARTVLSEAMLLLSLTYGAAAVAKALGDELSGRVVDVAPVPSATQALPTAPGDSR